MSCRLDTLADTTFSCVCDMTETCRDMSPDTTQNVAIWAQKRHADIRHMELSHLVLIIFWILIVPVDVDLALLHLLLMLRSRGIQSQVLH